MVAVEAIPLLIECNHRYFYNDQCKYRSRNSVVHYTWLGSLQKQQVHFCTRKPPDQRLDPPRLVLR